MTQSAILTLIQYASWPALIYERILSTDRQAVKEIYIYIKDMLTESQIAKMFISDAAKINKLNSILSW